MHGVYETSPITDEMHAFRERLSPESVDLADRRLVRIVRLRLLGERGFPFWDLSYCYGVLGDGTAVRVTLPQHQFPVRGLERALVEMCKNAGRYGKGLGIFDALSTLR